MTPVSFGLPLGVSDVCVALHAISNKHRVTVSSERILNPYWDSQDTSLFPAMD
jgi:hypothetical protein